MLLRRLTPLQWVLVALGACLAIALFIENNPIGRGPGGLRIEDLAVGTGAEAKDGSIVVLHYVGKLEDGTVFDSSIESGKPIEFILGQGRVIDGWERGIPGMRVGGTRRLTIPPELAYGDKGSGPIPPRATLTFDIELVAVK